MLGIGKKNKSAIQPSAAEKRIALKDGSLEFPSFMSPEQAREMLQNRLDFTAKRMKQLVCVNARIIVTPAKINKSNKSVHPGDIQFDKAFCQNNKRNGSKFCQACSDKHHGIEASTT